MVNGGARAGGTFLVLRLLPLLLVSTGALPAQQQQGALAGEIRLQDGTFPKERLQVTLEAHGTVVAVTFCDYEGSFGFGDLGGGVYQIVIESDGYQPVRQQVNFRPSNNQFNLVRVVLRPKDTEKPQSAPDEVAGANPDMVNVAELAKKFPPTVIRNFKDGMKAEQRGEMTAAVRLYEAALREAPDFYPAINNLGIRHLQKGDVQAAEAEFRRVIELNQNGAQAYFNLGNVLYMTHRNDEAKQTLEAGLRLSPSNAMGHYLNGSVLTRLGDFKAAEEQLKTAGQLNPRMPQVTISLATLYLQSGREHEAAAMFESFLKQFPTDPMVPKVRAALNKMAQSSSPQVCRN
jgi:tetratricopeptide (TPR) repeat protein